MSRMSVSVVLLALMALTGLARSEEPADRAQIVHHVVLVKFKADASAEKIKEVEEAFAQLKSKIPTVRSLHWGTNVSPEHRDHGYTHCFLLTFANAKDRDGYLVDPAHKDFVKLAGPSIDDVLVVDFAEGQ